MQLNSTNWSRAIGLAIVMASAIAAQNARVEVSKHTTAIPKSCRSLAPAVIEPTIDIPALVREAICKGAGDMLVDFTYVMDSVKRDKDDHGKVKEERITYEVFIPTLKSGTSTRGVLVVTSHNQVPVPPDKLQKERLKAAEKIEKEENKIALETPEQPESPTPVHGLAPLGEYTRSGMNRVAFGARRGGVTMAIPTFLRACELTFARQEQFEGRETLIFTFTPRPDSQFTQDDKYMAQLKGEIWIDAQDRIVTRLAGWPSGSPVSQPPAVYVEMMRVPKHAIWLPHVNRINGADYPKLFDGIATDSTTTFSNYIRFSTEVNDVKVGTTSNK